MAKRFTDTEKWKKPFIRSLQAPYKLLWLYILDDCDHSGIWQVEREVVEIRIGQKIDWVEAQNLFKDKIRIFNEKWFIQDFIDFQYGKLNPENRAHKSVLDKLEKYKIKPLGRSLQGRKDKDKDMVKDKDEETFFDAYELFPGAKSRQKNWEDFQKKHKNEIKDILPKLKQAIEKEIIFKQKQKDSGWAPQWANFSTWLNQRRWEQELGNIEENVERCEYGLVV